MSFGSLTEMVSEVPRPIMAGNGRDTIAVHNAGEFVGALSP